MSSEIKKKRNVKTNEARRKMVAKGVIRYLGRKEKTVVVGSLAVIRDI